MVAAPEDAIRLPAEPFPVQIEIEFTGACNAHCTACPRGNMPRFGVMSEDTLRRIIALYRDIDLPRGRERPECIVAGGGEPLLHKRAVDFLRLLVDSGFRTILTTNASRVTKAMAEQLATMGLDHIYVSFWGINADEYERAMRLAFRPTLDRVLLLAARARDAGTKLSVKWLQVPELVSTNEDIERFWHERNIATVTGYHDIWNRAGQVSLAKPGNAGHPPDPARRIWCADLYFSDAFSWNGQCVLCCCNYFTRKQITVGDIALDTPREFSRRKLQILMRRPLPDMCRSCILPRDTRGRRLARGFLPHLSREEAAMLTDYPGT